MQCPQCGSRSLRVEVAFSGLVTCRFLENDEFELIEPVALDSSWNDRSRCLCVRCPWRGVVADARHSRDVVPPEQSVAGPVETNAAEPLATGAGQSIAVESRIRTLADVKEHLKLRCEDPVSRECVEYLVSEVERLGALLENVQRVAEKEKSSQDYGDTSVL